MPLSSSAASRIFRSGLALCLLLVLAATAGAAPDQFRLLDRSTIESRLRAFSTSNRQREQTLARLFDESGCPRDDRREQEVPGNLPNLICILPGKTEKAIVVGAHFDKVQAGQGVIDNWSGAVLLPSLLYSLNLELRRHTFIFVNFSAEEKGLEGSRFYVRHLPADELHNIDAMVNLDTLALGPTKVWASHADERLLAWLEQVASGRHLPLGVFNVDEAGSTDSESFAAFDIPRITVHSLTKETWWVLHSPGDNWAAVRMEDYYSTYRLLAAYLSFLDGSFSRPAKARHD
jgi:putative aminopeptidase FrvX